MTKDQEDILNMYESSDDVLQENNTVWSANIPFKTAVEAFEAQVDTINNLRDRQEANTTGVTQDKENKRITLETRAYQIGSIVAFYGSVSNKRELLKKVSFTQTKLSEARDNELPGMANQIHQGATDNAAALLAYGITDAMITNLQTAIDDFVTYISKPRAAKADTSAATAQMVKAYDDADKTLKEQIDKGMELYRFANDTFYINYFKARIIVNSPTLKRALDVHFEDSLTHAALEHVSATIDSTIHKRSSNLGNIRQQSLAEGAHSISSTLPGYNALTQPFNVISGETTKIIIAMVKV